MAAVLPLAGLLDDLSIPAQLNLVLLPIALLGVMHGGADPWVGQTLMQRCLSSGAGYAFFTIYLAMMAMVLLAWWAMPLATLVAFLALSVLHFGVQDATTFDLPRRPLDACVLGAIPVLGPVVGDAEGVAVLFAWLAGIDPVPLADRLTWVARPLACLWLIGIGMVVSRVALEQGAARARRLSLAVAVLGLVVTRLPPLIAFALYFCLLHSFGHLLEMATSRTGPWSRWSVRQWALRLWPATLGAIALGLIGGSVLASVDATSAAPGAQQVRVLFWGLAALTVPHVVLHAAWGRATAGSRG